MKKTYLVVLLLLFLVSVIVFKTPVFAQKNIEITGAGATFPYPLYQKMFDVYYKEFGIKVNYQSIGSGGGIKALIDRTIDFGATDAPMTDDEEKKAGMKVIHIPTSLGAVAVTYNLPGNPQLHFSGEVLADIFMGKISKWNDPKIQNENLNVKLPNMTIFIVRRTDGSGTTFTFTEYLSKVSSSWINVLGTGKTVNWQKNTLGGKGNTGVAVIIQQTSGSIGYVEVMYAVENKMMVAGIKNKSGKFVLPDLKSISAAADIVIHQDTKVSLTNTSAANGYPIATFTWIIFYKEQSYNNRSFERAKATLELFYWMINKGQVYTELLQYGALDSKVVKIANSLLYSAVYEGKPIFKKQ